MIDVTKIPTASAGLEFSLCGREIPPLVFEARKLSPLYWEIEQESGGGGGSEYLLTNRQDEVSGNEVSSESRLSKAREEEVNE